MYDAIIQSWINHKSFSDDVSEISDVCVQDITADKVETFLSTSSLNTCRECINKEVADRTKQLLLELEWQNDPDSLHQLEDLLEPRHSYALVDMTRLKPKNRQKNEQFGVVLCYVAN